MTDAAPKFEIKFRTTDGIARLIDAAAKAVEKTAALSEALDALRSTAENLLVEEVLPSKREGEES